MLAEFNRDQNFKWLNYIKEIVISIGEPGLFNQNFIHNPKATKDKIVNKLNDLYIQAKNGSQTYGHPQQEETIVFLNEI